MFEKQIPKPSSSKNSSGFSTGKRTDIEEIQDRFLLASIVEASDDAIISKTLDGIITSWNPAAERMFGYTAQEIVGKPKTLLFPPDLLHEEERILNSVRQGISISHFETVRIKKNGMPVHVSITISPVKDACNRVVGVSTIARDITEWKRNLEVLKESEQRLQTALSASNMGIWELDLTRQMVRFLSEETASMLGLASDVAEITFAEFAHRVYVEDREGLWQAVEIVCGMDQSYEHVFRVVRPNGMVRWMHINVHALCDREGQPVRLIGTMMDITGRKQDEETLALAMKELESRNWELVEARDAALSAARVKSNFLANMSHEIRTPLNGVIGMGEVLSYTSLDSNQQSYLRTIRQSAEGLLGIINDILDFSKIESGKLSLESIPFSLRDALEDTAALLTTKAHEKGLEVCCVLPPLGTSVACTADPLLGDPTRLKQIVTNLLSNAIKFTENGEIVLGAELLRETPYEARWRVFVRDTGIGVPRDRQEAIFESFTQADGSTTRRFGGTGLGLTISRQLAALMGGQIALLSEPGKGSEFRVELSFQKQTVGEAGVLPEPKLTLGQSVFIVDNNAVCRNTLSDLLSAWGCSVTTAQDGREALEILERPAFRETPPDLLLLDMLMPEMNGKEFMQHIKRMPRLNHIPVLLLCSIGAAGVLEAMNDPAFTACLCKPVRQSELANLVRRLWSKQENISLFPASEEALDQIVYSEETTNRQAAKEAVRILLAEDVAINQMVAWEMLKKCGISLDTVKTVENGREVMEALEQETFDIILMDVQMPEMNGWEAATAIRAREQEMGSRHIPILAMTAHALPEDKEACFSAGMDDYICKPLEIKVLSAMLDRWLPASCTDSALQTENPGNPPAKTAASELPVICLDRLELVTAGDKNIEQALLHEFLSSVPKMLLRCELAVETADAAGLEHWGHALKGSSRTVGADRFASLCQELESLGKQNLMQPSEACFISMKNEWTHLENYLVNRLGMAK